MTDNQESHKRTQPPLSLNQRHNRILSDLSASHSKPISQIPGEEICENQSNVKVKKKLQGRRRLCKAYSASDAAENEDVFGFSGIADFDSPSPPRPFAVEQLQQQNQSKFTAEADDFPSFSGIADFDSPSPLSDKVRPSNVVLDSREVCNKDGNADETRSSSSYGDSDLVPHPPGEEGKLVKVRIEGSRSPCRASRNDGYRSKMDIEITKTEESKGLGISDCDSSPWVKTALENSYGGGMNEIRDILNDLSSRLEILSIEKKREPRRIDLKDDSKHLSKSEVNHAKNNEEIPDYESAASSFSTSSGSSVASAKESDIGYSHIDDFKKNNDFDVASQIRNSYEKLESGMKICQPPKNDIKKVIVNSDSARRSFESTLREEGENEDNDCFIVSGKDFNKKGVKWRKSNHLYEDSDNFDALEDPAVVFVSEEEHVITLTGPKFTFRLPGKIGKMLYPHQRDGLKWLWSLHSMGVGGVLGDDMGLGKTMQICGFLAGLFHSNLIKRALVVAPKTLLPHWVKELSTVGLAGKTREYFGTSVTTRQYELQYVLQDKGILLTTYDIVRNNVKSLSGDYYYNDEGSEDEMTWDYIILDKGHLIKNPSTQRAKSLLQIPAAHRIIISGTPLQNNLKELWALFNFCCPEILGDYKWFREKYEKLINRGNEKNASDREKRIGSTVAKELREKIQPYFLRRLKSEVFSEDDSSNSSKLSKKNEIIVWLKLTRCQRQIYEAFLKSEIVLSAFDGSPLAALTILKKICDHPRLLTKRAAEDVLEGMDSMLDQQDHDVAEKLAMHIADVDKMFDFEEKHDISCKTSFILSLLDDLIPKGHHVLIFSQTRKMLNLIQESLISNGYEFMRIDGTTKACDRLKIVNDFQEGRGAPIFLLTSQVGGLGLTLTKADRVIVVDPAWNPSTDNQSVDRAYRIGQMKDVIVYRLMTCSTVEEKIYRLQIFKGGLFRTATEHKEQMRYFSKQDLQELFSLPKQGFDISVTRQQLLEQHGQQQMMEDSLKAHIKFLEGLDIAGVSQHSLLFSKAEPEPVAQEEEVPRVRGATFRANSSSRLSNEEDHSAQYAFNPKDVKLLQKNSSPSASEPTEAEITAKINRLCQILGNKATMSKLPDNGEKIRKQIALLNLERDEIRKEKGATGENFVHLEDLSQEFERMLNMKM
ncbi:protein CHROMATIN REMODELING 24-like isoform X1 [Coffea arabica]|uniref:Protein CHROMATIN REMODELING 24-like isoform X1 n=1 Tax=Coffea arabica TaxID=13443 RepID=A0ABM4WJD0_COFAR